MKKIPMHLLPIAASFFSFNFLNAQNIGIGITVPAERLHVVHTADVNKNAIYGYASQVTASGDYQNTGVAGFGQGNGVAGGFGYGFGVKGIGSLNSYGAVGVYAGLGTTIPQNNTIGGSFYSLYADAGIPAANRYAGVFLNGNVGIGTSSPSTKLDVNGDMNVTGAIKTNGNAGTAGQVLVSNGVTASWQNQPVIPASTWTPAGGDIYNSNAGNVGIGTTTPQTKLDVNGFAKLGEDAPKIKMKTFTGTTSSTDGGGTTINLGGISITKVLAVDMIIQLSASTYTHAGYSYGPGYAINFQLFGSGISVLNVPGNSYNVFSKPVRVLVTYEE